MPITIKSTELKYKNPSTGQYQGIDAVAERTTSEQCALIEAKGAETIASIPSDYTTLSDTVDDLTSDVSDLSSAITSLATVISVSQLSDLSSSSSHFVNFGANVTVGAYDIPRYSKGILVASSASDAVLIAVSAIGTIYTAYRNGGTWTKMDLKPYAPVVRSTPVAIPSSSATYTLDGITPYYHLVSWGFQSSSGNPIPENKAPCDLTWSTANGIFTITKTDDRPLSGQKICPIFEYVLDKQAT